MPLLLCCLQRLIWIVGIFVCFLCYFLCGRMSRRISRPIAWSHNLWLLMVTACCNMRVVFVWSDGRFLVSYNCDYVWVSLLTVGREVFGVMLWGKLCIFVAVRIFYYSYILQVIACFGGWRITAVVRVYCYCYCYYIRHYFPFISCLSLLTTY